MRYGVKRDYPKIDIYHFGKYECSTTWSKTCKEAKQQWIIEQGCLSPAKCVQEVKASFSKTL